MVFFIFAVLWICIAAWIFSDGRDRDATILGLVFALLAIGLSILVLPIWLICRPPKKVQIVQQSVPTTPMLPRKKPKLCPHCGKYYEYNKDFIFCPNCGGSITNKNELSL